MKISTAAILIIPGFLLCIFPFSQASANCWATYDESYRSSLQSAMGQPMSSHAGNFSSRSECEDYLSQMFSDPVYSGDAGLRKTRCECDSGSGDEGGSPATFGGSSEGQVAGGLAVSFVNGLINGLSHLGPSPEELARQKWTKEEKDRRAAEIERNKLIFAQAQQDSVALLGGRPQPVGAVLPIAPVTVNDGAVYIGNGTMPAILRKSDAVQEAEWNAVSQQQQRIDLLLVKKSLTPDEIKELKELEAKRNDLWKKAVSTPGLTQEERSALRIKVPVINEDTVSVDDKQLIDLHETASEETPPKSILTTMTEASVTFGVQTAVETWGDDAAEKLAEGGHGVMKFGDALLIGGAIKAVANGDIEEMGESSASWGYGKLATIIPGAGLSVGMAQGVGAVTTATFRRSWDAVLTETDKAVPGFLLEGGAKQWWEEMKEGMSSPQRFCMGALSL